MDNKVLAAIKIAPDNGFTGFGPLGTNVGTGINTLTSVISTAIGLMTVIAVIWFIFVFITGAIALMTAGGDKQAVESAKKKITTGLIGLVVVIIATFAIDLVGFLLGFSVTGGILNLNEMFTLIQIR